MSWADKYRPTRMSELIISDGILQQIIKWLELWKAGTPVKKALILYGPPGTGKTTTAHVIAREAGWPVIEMNASDQRNRESIRKIAMMASLYRDLSFDYESGQSMGANKIILVDEADNIFEGRSSATGGDTGGISELNKVIKETMNPVILTMNDFYEFRRKSSAREIIDNSLTIEFKQYKRRNDSDYKQFRMKFIRRVNDILEKENVRIRNDLISEILERNSNDIRGTLNDIESLRSISPDMLNAIDGVSQRDSTDSIYNIISKTFKSENYDDILRSLYGKDFTTEDYMMWIDNNLPAEAQEPEDLMNAYDYLSLADRFIGRVRKKQHYAFKMYAEEISAGISLGIRNRNTHYVKYQFPSFIMKSSRMKESRRSRRSLLFKLGKISHMSVRKIRDQFWFYREVFGSDKKSLKELSEKLVLSEKEEGLFKRKRS